jgi:hypothetical protein
MMMMNNGLSQQVLHRPKAELVFRSSSFPAKNLNLKMAPNLPSLGRPLFPPRILFK